MNVTMSIRYTSTTKILLDIVFGIYKMKNLFDQKFLRETICFPGGQFRIRRSLYIYIYSGSNDTLLYKTRD